MHRLIILRFLTILLLEANVFGADILMVTMGGTRSHKIPFRELAKGLLDRGHKITFLNGFTSDVHLTGLTEITPPGLVEYIQEYTNWDLLGARMKNKMPLSIWDSMRYAFESCDVMLKDGETKKLFNRTFDLAILDGTYPECALGIIYEQKIPFMYINTVGFFTLTLGKSGSPASYAVTPNFFSKFTDNMDFLQRSINTFLHISTEVMHRIVISMVHRVLLSHLGPNIPHPYEMSKNVSFILQNGHFAVSYPRALNPNVAEIACIHCKQAKPLPKELEEFISMSGDLGFIYVSMGSSVKAAKMPQTLRTLLLKTFSKLPYQVLWKYDGSSLPVQDLPPNVQLYRWLPQQDILGHKKLRAFITHGGLLSLYESVFHGVPLVSLPVFCDHDVNSAKAESDGYAVVLDLKDLTVSKLLRSINKVINDPQYKNAARFRQTLLRDQRWKPLETSVYWTEYVLRHKGAYHLQAPGRNLSWIQYYLIDLILAFVGILFMLSLAMKFIYNSFLTSSKRLELKYKSL